MSILPLFKHFHAVNIPKAFILNALVAAIVASFATEMRASLDNTNDDWFRFFDKILPGNGLGTGTTTFIVFTTTFLITMIVYHVMYLLFEYGGGLLMNKTYLHNGRLNYM